ncbi:uncharacterized protein MEPE_01914 [Melanopsichium pennsylvanicum]|uniref:Uncharacterized protein n=2 Tax=Melanopsichium pennsylvanicum TaxID=63383 RepID=A0AAJ4XJD1_9BASI|nr:putative protein [Melanopsichium pennsylvanicum 4]SNX83208.1 uncharacterized protein MEPE_01914 [Melanopsichium pennsylvanicum]
MSFNDPSSNTSGTQPLSAGDDRLHSDNNFTDQSSAHPNPAGDQPSESGETIDQGGYGLSASGGDQFAKENQTGQGFSSTQPSGGQFKPSVQDSAANETSRSDAPQDPGSISHRAFDL